ncbi:FtsX-like permease family protein [Roseateles sp. DAIF2]|uniref:FtsX-like permease family protein n=1 Tax=Roseateles sp. DAIF2 TaxID=2714952 RepID=UPI0018A26584|nr:FtsX-like permease family protein [Roseateles sp. DAIF2]QPF73921.1 FtsX-like permease family protein [Roseateles sp. DAIF2]
MASAAAGALTLLPALLRALSWPALRAQGLRQLLALLAVALGVALAYGVHLMNASALAEFGAAQRQLAGTPDLLLSGRGAPLPETALDALALQPAVALAQPLIEARAQLLLPGERRAGLRLLGLDALLVASFNPALLPHPFPQPATAPLRLLAPDALYLNEAALRLLGEPRPSHLRLRLQPEGQAPQTLALRLAGQVAAPGEPLAVLDIAAAQALLGRLGRLDRIELRLRPGASPQDLTLPSGVSAAPPADEGAEMARLTRAYRVNLGVLALMALFTGSFLVFAVQSLSVAQRLPQLALLGVLGLSARQRAALVLSEAALLGLLGSLLGLALGAGLAQLGLRLLGGDLGSGLLGGPSPALRIEATGLLLFGGLGLAICMASALLPALAVRRMAPAQVLKGLGGLAPPRAPRWLGPALLLAGAALAALPPVLGLPLGAYLGMLCLLLGGLLCVPGLVMGLAALPPPGRAGALLLRERSRRQSGEATQMLAGVLVALALSVAMLVMVSSFRDSLSSWLRQMLPADLYVRSSLRAPDQQSAPLPAAFVAAVRDSRLAAELGTQRSRRAWLMEQPVQLLARPLPDERRLPLVGDLAEPPASGLLPLYLNEALRDQLDLKLGQRLSLALEPGGATSNGYLRGVWRDYSRQSGALLMAEADYRRWSGDATVTELFLWLRPGQEVEALQAALRALAAEPQDLDIAASGELLALSMHLFDRSFAVTYWLQAVALGLGLFGIAASLSAQVLARRREFGLLLHLGFTRARLLALLVAETALFSAAGALAGLLLGLAISAVLVFVVNPQSFHWSMDMSWPWQHLTLLLLAVLAAALATSWLSGRQLGRADAVQAVREDW